jgi:hypothetical protein
MFRNGNKVSNSQSCYNVIIAYTCIDYANGYYLNMKQGSQGCWPSLQNSTKKIIKFKDSYK